MQYRSEAYGTVPSPETAFTSPVSATTCCVAAVSFRMPRCRS